MYLSKEVLGRKTFHIRHTCLLASSEQAGSKQLAPLAFRMAGLRARGLLLGLAATIATYR